MWVPFTLLLLNSKIIQIRFILIAFFMILFLQSTIVEHFQSILDNEWSDIIFEALLEHNQSAHTAIPILERMDSLEIVQNR